MLEFKRDSVIALYLTGKLQMVIVRARQHLNVNKYFVFRTIAHYHDTGSIASCRKSEQKKNGKNDPKSEGQI